MSSFFLKLKSSENRLDKLTMMAVKHFPEFAEKNCFPYYWIFKIFKSTLDTREFSQSLTTVRCVGREMSRGIRPRPIHSLHLDIVDGLVSLFTIKRTVCRNDTGIFVNIKVQVGIIFVF